VDVLSEDVGADLLSGQDDGRISGKKRNRQEYDKNEEPDSDGDFEYLADEGLPPPHKRQKRRNAELIASRECMYDAQQVQDEMSYVARLDRIRVKVPPARAEAPDTNTTGLSRSAIIGV